MTTEIRNLSILIVLVFFGVAATSFYWSILQRDDLQTRADNPRGILAAQQFQRGRIYDRDGRLLADSVVVEDELRERVYLSPAINSAVGYYDFRYGAAGLEADFDDVLGGDIATTPALEQTVNDLLQRPGRGHDLRTTLSLPLQERLFAALQGQQGAGVVVDAANGEILASVSLPTFDPTELEDALLTEAFELPSDGNVLAAQSPLFNRVQNGRYQPGTAMHLPLLAMLLMAGYELDTPVTTHPQVLLPETQLLNQRCTPDVEITLSIAFRLGCSGPFIHLLDGGVTYEQFDRLMWQFGFYQPPPLFRGEPSTGPPAPPFAEDTASIFSLVSIGSGQGGITFSPLQSLRFVMAVANSGDVPELVLADAYRLADSTRWQPFDIPATETQLFSPQVAEQMRGAMTLSGDLYYHSGVAYVGEPLRLLSWFNGFLTEAATSRVLALVIVLEDAPHPDAAAAIGRPLLNAILTQ